MFFSSPVFAIEARKLGSFLLTQAMDKHPELGFESYDRLFPNQDTLPKGGFGNLIALPHFRIRSFIKTKLCADYIMQKQKSVFTSMLMATCRC
jgi:hypothetical protein